jgi:hypothetical protein
MMVIFNSILDEESRDGFQAISSLDESSSFHHDQ